MTQPADNFGPNAWPHMSAASNHAADGGRTPRVPYPMVDRRLILLIRHGCASVCASVLHQDHHRDRRDALTCTFFGGDRKTVCEQG
jgi:hypothetical protein